MKTWDLWLAVAGLLVAAFLSGYALAWLAMHLLGMLWAINV